MRIWESGIIINIHSSLSNPEGYPSSSNPYRLSIVHYTADRLFLGVFHASNALTLTRHAPYDLAESKAMSDLAKDFNISDVGLAKRCRAVDVQRSPVRNPPKLPKHRFGDICTMEDSR